jgi:hypothetical protein
MPKQLIAEMVKSAIFWLNSFPNMKGISDNMSPRFIVTGQSVDYVKHCRYQFGEYVQVHEPHDNSMAPRTVGTLALRPTGNAQGSFYLLSLATRRVINRARATKLPMPEEVIKRVGLLAKREGAIPDLGFEDRYEDVGQPEGMDNGPMEADQAMMNDDDDNMGIVGFPHEDESDLEEESVTSIELDDDLGSEAGLPADQTPEDDAVVDDQGRDHDEGDMAGIPGVAEPAETEVIPGVMDVGNAGVEDNVANAQQVLEESMDARYGRRTGRYDLRQRRERDYGHLFASRVARVEESTSPHDTLDGGGSMLATPQMNMKRGLKVFGSEGEEAVAQELRQLHTWQVMVARKSVELTSVQKDEALGYLMFLKRKRSGKVKGRACADERKQRGYINREEATSPTVATEPVFLTAGVDAMEGREVTVIDVPSAFM